MLTALVVARGESSSRSADLIIVLVLAGLLYLVTWYIWPYSPCRRCDGGKRLTSPLGDGTFRSCGWCGGSGKRMRTGRYIIGLLSKSDRERGMH